MKKIYLLLSLVTVFCACEDRDVAEPSMSITLEKTTYKVNESMTFKISGTADIVTFYSGQSGKEFEFRDRIKVDGTPQMTFTSFRQLGPAVASPDPSLRIMTSTNFNGIYNADFIALAKWKDITDRATLSTGADNTASGVIDLSDVSTLDSAVYIAFKYTGVKDASVAQPTWTIKNFTVNNKIADGSLVNVKTIANITWSAVNILNPARTWTYNTTQLQMAGGPANTDDNEDWLISQPLELKRVTRSLGVGIKNPATALSSYVFAGYPAAGTYKVTFEVINVNKFDTKTSLKEFLITVEP